MTNLQAKCLARYEEVMLTAEAHYDREFKRMPIVFSNKLTKTGGYFNWNCMGGVKIQLSNKILNDNGQAFIDEVPGHEAAHQIALELHRANVGHDHRWKRVMQVIGQAPERCHRLKTTQSSKFEYIVNGESIMLGAGRHRNIQNGSASYRCSAGNIHATDWIKKAKAVTPTKATRRPMKKLSKAQIVRNLIAGYKASGYTHLDMNDSIIINNVAITAGLTKALAKTYLNNNWS